MPEEKESKGEQQPPFDPAKLLRQLESIINRRKPSVSLDKHPTKRSLLSYLIIIAVVLVGIAIWSWISWRRNRELAKLRHEKNKAQILAEKAKADHAVATYDAAIAAAAQVLEEAREDLRVIEADIRAEEVRYEVDLHAIDRIRSWRDIPGPSE